MTASGIIIGLMLIALGGVMVWRARWFREYVGDIGTLFDTTKLDWLDWSIVGVILIIIGFMVMTGLFQIIAYAILVPIFNPSVG